MRYYQIDYNKIFIEIIKISLCIISIISLIYSFILINKSQKRTKLYLKNLAFNYIQCFNINNEFIIYYR